MTPGTAAWALAFQLSPIVLTGGLATPIPGSALPIIALTESLSFAAGLLSGGGPPDLNSYFANFAPMPGSTLAENQVGTYPFANQSVAANAIIAQPLSVSMLMICPARQPGGYPAALATMMALRFALDSHDQQGGTYTIITPKAFYTNCLRLRMVDVSTASSHQPQNSYQLDFMVPLLTQEQAQSVQSGLMSKLTAGTQISGDPAWSGAAASTGQPITLGGVAVPAGQSLPAVNTAPVTSTVET